VADLNLSPAERFALSKKRATPKTSALSEYMERLYFVLDDFQLEACKYLEQGSGVLVAAPTGAGKTIVGDFATFLAQRQGKRIFYTTPIKALSNQKYGEFMDRYGESRVGLLTGDVSINGDGEIVVMTTEVLRNMIYANSQNLQNVAFVVLDEVHYLGDKFRGAVWEEILIHLPPEIAVVSLSATVSNVEEFGEWLSSVRGAIEIIVSEVRPVPLHLHVMQGMELYPLLKDEKTPNAELVKISQSYNRNYRDRKFRSTFKTLHKEAIIERLAKENLLPAIFFIFSRIGCDNAVKHCGQLNLTTEEEKISIRERIGELSRIISPEDYGPLNFLNWAKALEMGVAAHHAGLIPPLKEVIEELFQQGLIKIVFATETLALGVNMPAKSVVIDRLTKWNGQSHVDISPGEFTQLTGRAGRRGIDIEGHAVMIWSPEVDIPSLAGLATARTFPLKSSFHPTYNMAVNLLASTTSQVSRELLGSSFAQFQADHSVQGLERQKSKNREHLTALAEDRACHLGDFAEYFAIRNEIKRAERSGISNHAELPKVIETLAQVSRGDVLSIGNRRRGNIALVLDKGHEMASPLVLFLDRKVSRISPADCQNGLENLGRIKVPGGTGHKNSRDKGVWINAYKASGLKNRPIDPAIDEELQRLRNSMRAHPCHNCPDREAHARVMERGGRIERDIEDLEREIEGRTNVIPRTFDRLCSVLRELGYLADDSVTENGQMLAQIYSDADLVLAESIRRGLLNELTATELAAVLSIFVFESRSDEPHRHLAKNQRVVATIRALEKLWYEIKYLEQRSQLQTMRELDGGAAAAIYAWAVGSDLVEVLELAELPAGDFVRIVKQLIDLLMQISEAAPVLRSRARKAVTLLRRGVITYSEVIG
jgi:ATP-dependent RNA helicase HelY